MVLQLFFLLASIGVPAYISVAIALRLALVPAYYHIRRNMIRYTVTDSKLEIDTGLSPVQLETFRSASAGRYSGRQYSQRLWALVTSSWTTPVKLVNDCDAQHQFSAPLCRPSFA